MNSCTPISVHGEESDVSVILAAGKLAGLKITDGTTQPQSQPNVTNTDKDKDSPNNNRGKKQETKGEVENYESGAQDLGIEKRLKPKRRGLKLITEKGCIRGKFAAIRYMVSVFCFLWFRIFISGVFT